MACLLALPVFSSLNEGLLGHQGGPRVCLCAYTHARRQACAQAMIWISVNESDKCALFSSWMLISDYYLCQYSLSEKEKNV